MLIYNKNAKMTAKVLCKYCTEGFIDQDKVMTHIETRRNEVQSGSEDENEYNKNKN